MSIRGPIIIAEDDLDDCQLLQEIFTEMGLQNELKFFPNGRQLLTYLNETQDQPFLILSDINMPVINGLELKSRINENERLKRKSIPFIFLTSSDSKLDLEKAYELMIQGYFQKEYSVEKFTQILENIVAYWKNCKHPNTEFIRPYS